MIKACTSTHPRMRTASAQSGSILIEALLAMVLLGGAALMCLHVGWQSLQSQARLQQWHDAIDALDNASTALHRWPQSLSDWQGQGPASANPCTTQACNLAEWHPSLALWIRQAVSQTLPQAQLEWSTGAPLSWQAGVSPLELPLGAWQLRWGSGDTMTSLRLVGSP
ncbi:MAG: hypothetical protein EBV20_03725 [Betaproteobacteria bacterium]|nr:hypothetical protein [Betaproteobacteria bacterium]